MRQDRPSSTASYVAMGRALAHARKNVRGFDDPFALMFLAPEYRVAVERRIRREWPQTVREARLGMVARAIEQLMGPRTVEIDDGLRALGPGVQLVLLGAGLDARAYRMPELAQSVAFEVDHPATQAFKKRQADGLAPLVRDLRYVPADFTRERMQDVLAAAGHRKNVPTAWIFEGVISYLSPREVEAAIDAIAERSAPGSRLFATYNEPSWIRTVGATFFRRSEEPQRAVFRPDAMRALLAKRGFVVHSDRDGAERAARWSGGAAPRFLPFRFHHVVIADRLREGSGPGLRSVPSA